MNDALYNATGLKRLEKPLLFLGKSGKMMFSICSLLIFVSLLCTPMNPRDAIFPSVTLAGILGYLDGKTINSETITSVVYVGVRLNSGDSQPSCCIKNSENGGLYNRAWDDINGCICDSKNCGCIDNTSTHKVNPLLSW